MFIGGWDVRQLLIKPHAQTSYLENFLERGRL